MHIRKALAEIYLGLVEEIFYTQAINKDPQSIW